MAKDTLIGNKTTIKTLREQQKLPLWKKIEHSKRMIRQFVYAMGGIDNCFCAYSGGLDSEILLHLVRIEYPECVGVFANTTNEYSETLKHVRKHENIVWVNPKKTFRKILQEIGFPLISKKMARYIEDVRKRHDGNESTANLRLTGIKRDGTLSKVGMISKKWLFLTDNYKIKFNVTSKCCYWLKEEPMNRYQKQTGKKPFVGTLAEESNGRESNYIEYGCNIFTHGNEKSRPLSIWTEQDIWDYAKINNIEINPLYFDSHTKDGKLIQRERKTGCRGCGFGYHLEKSDLFNQDRFDKYKLRSPKAFEKLMNIKNNDVDFRTALSIIKNAK